MELSRAPIFIWSEELRKRLLPLVCWNAFQQAQQMLAEDYRGEEETISKFRVCAIGCRIFITKSRAVQFFLIFYSNFMATALVFLPERLNVPMSMQIAFQGSVGLLKGIYAVLLLEKFFFPRRSKKGSSSPRSGRNDDEVVAVDES